MPAFEWSSAKVLFFHFLYPLHLSPPPYPDMSSKRSVACLSKEYMHGRVYVWSRRVVAFVHSIQLFSRASKANPKTRPVYYPSSSNHSAPDLSEAVVTKVFTEALRQPTVPTTTTTSNQHSPAAKAHYP